MQAYRVAGIVNPVNGATGRSYVLEMPRDTEPTFKLLANAAAQVYYYTQELKFKQETKIYLKKTHNLDEDSFLLEDLETDIRTIIGTINTLKGQFESQKSQIDLLVSRAGYGRLAGVSTTVRKGDFTCAIQSEQYRFIYRSCIVDIIFVNEVFPT